MKKNFTVLIFGTVILGGCTAIEEEINYEKYLNQTADSALMTAAVRETALARFVDFYKIFSAESILQGVRDLYAPQAYFRDGFREVIGLEAIEAYFVSSTRNVEECLFHIDDVAQNGGDYYFRWRMDLRLKRRPAEIIHAVGMSHVRFDREGRVIFQQDYWDTGALFARLPAIVPLVRWIRTRI